MVNATYRIVVHDSDNRHYCSVRKQAMVYLDTIEEWHRQSALLLQARPTTVRK